MIKKINKKTVVADKKNIATISVQIGNKKYSKRYLIQNGKCPKVAKDQLQDLINDILSYNE